MSSGMESGGLEEGSDSYVPGSDDCETSPSHEAASTLDPADATSDGDGDSTASCASSTSVLGLSNAIGASIFQTAYDEACSLPSVGASAQQLRAAERELRLPARPQSAPASTFNGNEPHQYFSSRLLDQILQMMYVSGETGEPSVETTGIIEEIVRQQVIEIVSLMLRRYCHHHPLSSRVAVHVANMLSSAPLKLRNCTDLAARRGSRAITINDLIFQIRDDAPKVSRLRTFLSWKDVRKNVKDQDDKGGEVDLGGGEDPVGAPVPGGPGEDTTKKNKKAKVGLPWEPSSFYSQEVPERDDEEDEEEEEMNYITLQRLRKADERTKAMSREEYVTWSEYRQASFTYRKGKRFREWAGFGVVTDSKPSDDIVDILGFLTFEMVQTLTEEALKIKEQEDLWKERTGGENTGSKKRKLHQGLFDPPSEGRTPIEPRHIQEAFRRLQARSKKSRAMLNGSSLQQRSNLRLVRDPSSPPPPLFLLLS